MPEYGVSGSKFEQHRSSDEYHKEALDLRLADDAGSAPISVQPSNPGVVGRSERFRRIPVPAFWRLNSEASGGVY
jgi:hypothetical protein